MKKVLVIGCPGSGKSTFSRALHTATGLPLCHLDLLYWNADKTTVSSEVFLLRLQEVLSREEWIIDGNYAATLPLRLASCDTVILLDLSVEQCLAGVAERRGKPRPDIPWVETEEDEEFTAYIKDFHQAQRPALLTLPARYPQIIFHIFHTREDADTFLCHLSSQ